MNLDKDNAYLQDKEDKERKKERKKEREIGVVTWDIMYYYIGINTNLYLAKQDKVSWRFFKMCTKWL